MRIIRIDDVLEHDQMHGYVLNATFSTAAMVNCLVNQILHKWHILTGRDKEMSDMSQQLWFISIRMIHLVSNVLLQTWIIRIHILRDVCQDVACMLFSDGLI